jgi:hypothetical protein
MKDKHSNVKANFASQGGKKKLLEIEGKIRQIYKE